MGKKFLLITLTSLTVFILGLVSFTFQFVTSTGASMNEEFERNEKYEERSENLSLLDGDPISILLMGVDSRAGEEGGRADTMILVTINPHTNSMHMVSIPRDTYAKIDGGLNKINSAYQVGGPEMTVHSVENLLDVPVDYFVELDMKGFEGIVNAYGGVEVKNDLEFTDKKVHFPKGEIKLDGKEALIYARMRKKDPRGDFGRQIRQRQVIEALMQKGESVASVTKFGEIIKVLQNNVKTNMNPIDMWNIQANYKNARRSIEEHKINGADKTLKGTYYYMPDKEKLHDLSGILKNHLELGSHPDQKPAKEEHQGKHESVKKQSDASNKENKEPSAEKSPMKKESRKAGSDEADDASGAKEKADTEESYVPDDQPNVKKVITDNWTPVPTEQENHTKVTFKEGSQDWEEMMAAISKGAGLSERDMILWWVTGDYKHVTATVTNKAQTANFRVYVEWMEGKGYAPVKVEELHENDQKHRQ